jgi:hypothetical protein
MTTKRRLQRLIIKLRPETTKNYYLGWADCTWSASEGLLRHLDESKEDFCKRVYQTTKKKFLWFD